MGAGQSRRRARTAVLATRSAQEQFVVYPHLAHHCESVRASNLSYTSSASSAGYNPTASLSSLKLDRERRVRNKSSTASLSRGAFSLVRRLRKQKSRASHLRVDTLPVSHCSYAQAAAPPSPVDVSVTTATLRPSTALAQLSDNHDLAFVAGRPHLAISGVPALLPADAAAALVDDKLHDAIYGTLGVSHFASVHRPGTVLDVGCGTGRWLADVARLFPHASLHGVDVVDHWPHDWMPANCQLTMGDLHDGLPFPDGHFDLIHQQAIRFYLPDHRWSPLIDELWRVCRPGGHVELLEYDLVAETPQPELAKALQSLALVARFGGVEWNTLHRLDELLLAGGFEQIRLHTVNLPIGDCFAAFGTALDDAVEQLISDTQPLLVNRFGLMDAEDYSRLARSFHSAPKGSGACLRVHIVTGRRPNVLPDNASVRRV